MQQYVLDGYVNVKFYMLFVYWFKVDIVIVGVKYNMFFVDMWFCYKGGEYYCGCCGICVEWCEVFYIVGVEDLIIYVDFDFWQVVIVVYGGV